MNPSTDYRICPCEPWEKEEAKKPLTAGVTFSEEQIRRRLSINLTNTVIECGPASVEATLALLDMTEAWVNSARGYLATLSEGESGIFKPYQGDCKVFLIQAAPQGASSED